MTFFELTIVGLIIVNSLMILILTFKVSSLPDNSIMKKWSEALESRLSRIWNNEDKLYREVSNTHNEIKKQNDESGILLDRIDLVNGNVNGLHEKLVEILKYVEVMNGTIKFLQDYMKATDNLEKSLNTTNKNINDSFDKFSKAFIVLSDDNKRTEETIRNEISALYSRLLELIDKISTGDSKDFIEVESLKNEINQYRESIEKGNEVIQQLLDANTQYEELNKQYLSRIQQLENEIIQKNSDIDKYTDTIQELKDSKEEINDTTQTDIKDTSHKENRIRIEKNPCTTWENGLNIKQVCNPPLSKERKKYLDLECKILFSKDDKERKKYEKQLKALHY